MPLWERPPGSEIRERRRHLETEGGRVKVRRHGLKLPGEKATQFPIDKQLSLPPELYALSLREDLSLAAVDASFDRSVERIDRTTAGHVPKRQAEQEVVRAAVDFEAFYETRTPPANDALSAQGLQVLSSDGKGVTMRPEALRDSTRKAAEAAAAEAIRGDPMGERKKRRSDKRMAVVTAVWEQEPHVRTAQDVLTRLRRDPEGRRRRPRSDKAPRPQNKRVAASLTKSHAEGMAEMFDEAERRNPDGKRRTLVLLDGDEKQIDYAQAEARTRGMSITIILDLIHVLHYLWKIATLLCAGEPREADTWVGHILLQLLTRHPLDVVATIRQTATNRRLSSSARKALDEAVEYLRKNSTRIHYAAFLADGLPIATGVIEGACRYLVQDRLGITGARWGLAEARRGSHAAAFHADRPEKDRTVTVEALMAEWRQRAVDLGFDLGDLTRSVGPHARPDDVGVDRGRLRGHLLALTGGHRVIGRRHLVAALARRKVAPRPVTSRWPPPA